MASNSCVCSGCVHLRKTTAAGKPAYRYRKDGGSCHAASFDPCNVEPCRSYSASHAYNRQHDHGRQAVLREQQVSAVESQDVRLMAGVLICKHATWSYTPVGPLLLVQWMAVDLASNLACLGPTPELAEERLLRLR